MEIITENYVSFETAKLLKEKGFDERTICKYAGEGGITERYYDDYRERVLSFDWKEGYLIEPLIEPKEQYEIIGDTISAPSQAMVMKWLREKGIIIMPKPKCFNKKGKCYVWDCSIYLKNRHIKLQSGFRSYEEACETAIKCAISTFVLK